MAISLADPLVRRMLRQTAIFTAILAAMLFVAAGTLAWPEAWIYLAGSIALGLASGLIIASRNPELLRAHARADAAGPEALGQAADGRHHRAVRAAAHCRRHRR